MLVPGWWGGGYQEGEDQHGTIIQSEPKILRDGAGDHSSRSQTLGSFIFTIRGGVNFGLSGMTEAAGNVSEKIGSEEEEETEINFRADMDQMGEELYILGVKNTVSLLF